MNGTKNNGYTITQGYKKSLIDSPSWALTYTVTEALARRFNIKTLAEIGVCRGHHSLHLLEAIPDIRIYSVDPWGRFADEYDNMYRYHTSAEDEKLYQKVCQLLKPFDERSIILRLTSRRAVISIKEPLDMVYLDGDHSYEGYKDDLNIWWNKVREGGIFSGRDYGHPQHPGVTRALDEFLAETEGLKFNLNDGRVWWIEKISTAKIKNTADINNLKIRPPLPVRLKRRIKKYFIMTPIIMKCFTGKIPGVKPAYRFLKKLWS
jgi:hypothetical protein